MLENVRIHLKKARTLIYLLFQFLLILAGALISQFGDTWGPAVGTGMIGTGACGVLVFGWVAYSDTEAERRRVLEDFGFVTAFSARSLKIGEEYQRRLKDARVGIDIMGYGLNALREQHLGSFGDWAKSAQVRILLVDPDTPYPNARDIEERSKQGKIQEEIRLFVDETRSLWSDPTIDFDVRYASSLPSVNMFRIDNESFWGPYLVSSPLEPTASRNLPTIIVRRPGYMFDRLTKHFDTIWESYSRSPDS